MSMLDKYTIITKIRSSKPESPVAVFYTGKKGIYNALFANTVVTQRKIDMGDKMFIGIFSGSDGVASFVDAVNAYPGYEGAA